MTGERRVALVTGSSSGIGAAVARHMADEGIKVVVNSARSAAEGRLLADTLADAVYVQADVADEGQAQGLVASAVAAFGRLDIVVNNAATTRFIPHGDLDAAHPGVWRSILDVNVIGAWQVATAAVPHLRETGGAIVNVSSQAGIRPGGSSIPYGVSKAALNHMTRMLAAALAPHIRVNAVAPGMVDTPWLAGHPDPRAAAEAWSRHAPLGRVGRPCDVAEAVLYLATAAYTTGEVLVVDGGAHLR